MSKQIDLREVMLLLLESCTVNAALRESLSAAAKLLQECKCQNQPAKRQEALAAVGMANAALDRLNRHNTAIMAVFTADTPEVVQ